ncbi:MAG: UDP-N-acetylmuramate dehydrogenase [bacterium]
MSQKFSPGLKALQRELEQRFGENRILKHEPLARYCNWKVGGPADLFLQVETTSELVAAIQLAFGNRQSFTVLGFGANSLVSDKGIRGLVILNRAERIDFKPDDSVEVDSGTNLALLARRAASHGLGGLEFLIGIPGTVGAAVAGNAGTREQWISTVLLSCHVINQHGELVEQKPQDLEFAYRHSRLKSSGEVVVSARLCGQPDRPANIERKMKKLLDQRKNQPGGSSAGSVFKNPAGDFAGRLIEACGLKGYATGGAQISQMHANFILNTGGATAEAIKTLIERCKSEVASHFGIHLVEEIKYLGDWS